MAAVVREQEAALPEMVRRLEVTFQPDAAVLMCAEFERKRVVVCSLPATVVHEGERLYDA